MHSLYLQVPWIIIYQNNMCSKPSWSYYLSEVIAKRNFLIALLLVGRMFEFTPLTPQIEFIYPWYKRTYSNWYKIIVHAVLKPPEAGSFLEVSTHLPPTVIPSPFHFLKWLLFNNIRQYWCNMSTCRRNRNTCLEWDLVSSIHGSKLNRNFGMICWFSHMKK